MALLVVIDTNVVISALIRDDGPPAQVLGAVEDGLVIPVVSPILLTEFDRVAAEPVHRRNFDLSHAAVARVLLEARGRWHADPPALAGGGLTRDPADDYLVRLSVAAYADCIVSGDKDLRNAVLPVRVLTPRQLLDELSIG